MPKLFLALIISILFACSTNKDTIPSDNTEAKFRFKVAFYSIGTGIDVDAKTNFDFFITDYEKQQKIKVDFQNFKWGREGEIDYCFRLSKMTKSQQNYFIEETKEFLKMSSQIRFDEDCECKPI